MRELFYDRCVHTGNTELLGQWDERNAPLTPKTVSYGSKKKLWWHCREGHSWQAAVYNRSAGAGCPYCAGKAVESGGNDLASVYPELAKQWDAVKNAPLTPADVTPHTHRKVWWKCPAGHRWKAAVLLPRRCAGKRLPGLRRKNTGAQYKMVTILEMPVRLRQRNHCRVTPATNRKDKKLRLS